MTAYNFLWTIVCVFGIAVGQILFKQAARNTLPEQGLLAMFNSWMIAALVLYGGATLLWIYVLRSTPLGLAYPLFALAFLIVPVLSSLFLGEPLRLSSLIGGVLIVVGVYVSTRGT